MQTFWVYVCRDGLQVSSEKLTAVAWFGGWRILLVAISGICPSESLYCVIWSATFSARTIVGGERLTENVRGFYATPQLLQNGCIAIAPRLI